MPCRNIRLETFQAARQTALLRLGEKFEYAICSDLNEAGYEPGPTGLMTCAKLGAIVASVVKFPGKRGFPEAKSQRHPWRTPLQLGIQKLTLTISIGLALSSEFGDCSVDEIMYEADLELYAAKAAGSIACGWLARKAAKRLAK